MSENIDKIILKYFLKTCEIHEKNGVEKSRYDEFEKIDIFPNLEDAKRPNR